MCLSEHPFGTIKRAVGATFFLLTGLRKVTGEFALMEGENGNEKQNDYINCSSVQDNAIICLWRKRGRYSPFVRAGADAD